MSREHKKFERLFLFSEVAKHLSFTEAAAELGISKGYLSEQIKQLEAEFGRPLMIRTTRNVRLTPQGELILASMGQVKESLLLLDRQVRHDTHNIAGQLRITAPSQFTARFLLAICNDFRAIYPEVHISVDCSYTLFDLTRNDFDLAFRATVNPPQNMVAKKLFDYQQTCCASPQYLAKHGTPKTIGELANHRCLTGSEKSTWTFDQQAHEVSGNLCVNDNHMLKQLALEHRGIVMVAEYQVDQEIKRDQLAPILTDHSTSTSALYLIHPQLIHQSARLSTFIQFTMDWFKNYLNTK